MNRKERNLGGVSSQNVTNHFEGGTEAQSKTSITLTERILKGLLLTEVDRLRNDKDETRRFFTHLFDLTAGEKERESFVNRFVAHPPDVTLGYPRTTAETPIFAITLANESEESRALEDFVDNTLDAEEVDDVVSYRGSIWESHYEISIFSQHPDECTYLYQFVKMVLLGARDFLHEAGLLEPEFSGGELTPDERFIPENMFVRIFRIKTKALVTVPRLIRDPKKIRITGIFREDINVDGIQGGVETYEES